MKRLLPALAALLMTTLAIQFDEKDLATEEALWNLYERWRAEHNLPSDQWPTQQEKVRRFGAFKDNVRFIHAHNQRPDRPSYTLRLNKFGDMGRDDFRATFGFRSDFKAAAPAVPGFIYQDVQDAPDSIDWREKGAVNPVKNQGKCGSCWAFSTVASVEGINQIKTGNLLSLSEQELVDCDTSDNDGCNGGLMANAFEFIKRNGGITTESAYPYTARRGTCDTFKAKQSPMVVIDGHQVVPENNEEAMMKAVANQPISVAIEASGQAFQFYSEGVFTGECGTELDHGVAVVGYGVTEEGRSYWIVRNSWGPEWGENGYIRMQRGVDASEGLCGIAMQPSYPLKTTSSNPTTKSRTRRELSPRHMKPSAA